MQHGPAPAVAGDSTDIIRQGPIRKGVLDLTPPAAMGSTMKHSTASSEKSQAAGQTASAGPKTPEAAPSNAPPAPSEALNTAKRVSGYQYLLIQSYPDEKRANDAKDLLTKNGIACNIEQNIPGWPNLYCVISQTGFPKASGAEYDKFRTTILQLNQSFKKDQKFMSFDPTPIRWKG
jgi:cell division septation protein DedD